MNIPNLFEIAGRHTDLYESFFREVWVLSDQGQKGYLDKSGLYIALKLVSLAQSNMDPSITNLKVDSPPPHISGHSSAMNSPALNNNLRGAEDDWAVKVSERPKYEAIFESLGPVDGKLGGDKVRPVLLNSGLPQNILGKIWSLSDVDQDGQLDKEEMTLALHLVYRALENDPVPSVLPPSLVPPGKRSLATSINRRTSLPAGPPSTQVLGGLHRGRSTSVTGSEGLGSGGIDLRRGSGGMSSGATSGSTSALHMMDSLQGNFSAPPGPVHTATSRSLASSPTRMTMPDDLMMGGVNPPPPGPPAQAWVVDVSRYETRFRECDTNHDGLVSGGDVKNVLLYSGLAQNYLAHIWGLVDINKTGTLSMEQFALAMYLIENKKEMNLEPPPTLPPDLVPPSFRSSPAGMTDASTHAEVDPLSKMGGGGSSNREIDTLTGELDNLQVERRELDTSALQLEADMTVKQSEIKNLEIELNTLESTVKQLERQQGEAKRRLDNLDIQTESLQKSLQEVQMKLTTDEHDVNSMKVETEQSTMTNQKEQELNEKRMQLHQLRDEENRLEVRLQMEKANLDTAAQQHGTVEKNIHQVETDMENLKTSTSGYEKNIGRLEEIVTKSEWNRLSSTGDSDLLTPLPKPTIGGTLMQMGENKWLNSGYQANTFAARSVPTRPRPMGSENFDTGNESEVFGNMSTGPSTSTPIDDPFRQVNDPFAGEVMGGSMPNGGGGGDPFGGHDPFGGSADPFAVSNGNAGDPFGGTNDPFAATTGGGPFDSNDPFASQPQSVPQPQVVKKMPPSRPPPPKGSRSQTPASGAGTPVNDPFASLGNEDPFAPAAPTASTGNSNDGFANFADFANFS